MNENDTQRNARTSGRITARVNEDAAAAALVVVRCSE